jgi:predicted nucleotidyltransferase component of viral defense system
MNSSGAGYTRLYNLQDRFLQWFVSLDLPFYLTGGTALGRFYLNHRYSNDLDFFVNNDPFFNDHISTIRKNLEKQFTVDIHNSLFSDDFLLGKDNTLGKNKLRLKEALPISN